MRKTFAIVVILGLLALGSAVFAQGGYGSEYATQAFQGPRAHVGWVDPGDVDSTVIIGASYIWQNALLSANYFKSDVTNFPGVVAKMFSLEASYIWRAETDPGLYYGGGYGFAYADISGPGGPETDTTGMWNIVIGKEFNSPEEFGEPGLFVEARWNLATRLTFDVEGDINGPRVVAGWKF